MTHPLFKLLRDLDEASISYTLGRHRDDTILITMTLVGERVEVDVFEDGHMEVSRFTSSEDIIGDEKLVRAIIEENREPAE
jgi:hypothetical protein